MQYQKEYLLYRFKVTTQKLLIQFNTIQLFKSSIKLVCNSSTKMVSQLPWKQIVTCSSKWFQICDKTLSFWCSARVCIGPTVIWSLRKRFTRYRSCWSIKYMSIRRRYHTIRTQTIQNTQKRLNNLNVWSRNNNLLLNGASTKYIIFPTTKIKQKFLQDSEYSFDPTLCENCPNMEFFLVRIFPHSDWIRRDTLLIKAYWSTNMY